MTPDITIICNVQRIGPVYETKRIYFGLNVSVGLTQAQASWDDTVDDLLKPWNWNLEDAGIEILVADRTACSFQPVKDVVIVDAKLSMDVSPLVKRLDEQYDLLKNHSKDNLAPFLWPDDCDISGAVLPILHLNGYKIANPTVLARIPHAELEEFDARLRLRAVHA